MKDLLRVKFELLTTPLFITLFIISVINIGFLRVSDIIFNIMLFFSIPACYYGFRISRKLMYEVWYGEDDED